MYYDRYELHILFNIIFLHNHIRRFTYSNRNKTVLLYNNKNDYIVYTCM